MSADNTTKQGIASSEELVVFRVRPAADRVYEIRRALEAASTMLARSARRSKDPLVQKVRGKQATTLADLRRDYGHFC